MRWGDCVRVSEWPVKFSTSFFQLCWECWEASLSPLIGNWRILWVETSKPGGKGDLQILIVTGTGHTNNYLNVVLEYRHFQPSKISKIFLTKPHLSEGCGSWEKWSRVRSWELWDSGRSALNTAEQGTHPGDDGKGQLGGPFCNSRGKHAASESWDIEAVAQALQRKHKWWSCWEASSDSLERNLWWAHRKFNELNVRQLLIWGKIKSFKRETK